MNRYFQILHVLGAVSYTHLDVYKRQPIYAAMIEKLDDSVDRICQVIKTLGIADRTIVIFYSDNGAVSYTHLDVYKRQIRYVGPIQKKHCMTILVFS